MKASSKGIALTNRLNVYSQPEVQWTRIEMLLAAFITAVIVGAAERPGMIHAAETIKIKCFT